LKRLTLHGGAKAASLALGINQGAASDAYIAVKKKAALQGYAPDHDFTRPVPEGYVAKGVSTYYNSGRQTIWSMGKGIAYPRGAHRSYAERQSMALRIR
jgi:hypothetical protein